MVRESGRSWKRAFLIGLAIAAVPIIGINALLTFNVLSTSQREVDGVASEVLSIVERRLDDAATALIALGLKGVSACGHDGVDALQRAAVRVSFATEFSIVDGAGDAECSASGTPRVVRRMSPEHGTIVPEALISTVAVGETGAERFVRLQWRYADGRGLRVLTPGDELLPRFLQSRLSAAFIADVVMIDGARVTRKLLDPQHAEKDSSVIPSILASAASHRYPLRVDIEITGGSLQRAHGWLFVYGNLGGLVFALITAVATVLISRRSGGPVREIHDAIRNGEFILYYQPVIDIRSGRLLGCEALARWRKPDGRMIPPGRFIALAEASGEIFPMTLALLERAREDLSETYAERPYLKLGFNLFAGHFDDTVIVDDVKRIFEGSRIDFSQLMFEVTERQQLSDMNKARLVISKLQSLGARVALDDVGTGHGGLSYLLKLGVDVMKMDKMFVDAIGTDRYSVAIVDGMVKLAEDMNLDLIAEGVETLEQVEYLRGKGVRMAQGYVFAPPLPAASFIALAKAMTPKAGDVGATPATADQRQKGAA